MAASAKSAKEELSSKVEHARDMFSAVVAHHGGTANPADLARRCFHYADHFKDAESSYLNGTLEPEEDLNPYDDASAPNLSKSHPINLMSKRWGSIEEVLKHFDAISKLDRSSWREDVKPDDIVYEDAHWTVAQVMTADAMFPAFIKRFEKCEKRKKALASKRNIADAETVGSES